MSAHFKRIGFYRLLSLSLASVMLPTAAQAMMELSDEGLSQIGAQAGIRINTSFSRVDIDELYWQDNAGTATNANAVLRGYADNISLTGSNLGATLDLDFGSRSGLPGINFDLSANIGTAAGSSFRVCDGTGAACGGSFGALTLQTSAASPLRFNLQASDGLFNESSIARVQMSLNNLNIYFNQAENASNPSGSINNQVILKGFNFNVLGTGYAYVSADGGIRMQTQCPTGSCTTLDLTPGISLARVADAEAPGKTRPGLNVEMTYKENTGSTYSITGAKGMIRVGASGDMTNAFLTMRGTNGTGLTDTSGILGPAYAAYNSVASTNAVMGNTGFALRFGADFLRTGSNPVTLELAHAGPNSYGLQFGNLSPLQIRALSGCNPATPSTCIPTASTPLNSALSSFDSGNIYVNLANTGRLLMPQNTVLNQAPMGSGTAATTLTSPGDYNFAVQNVAAANQQNMLVWGVRGMTFNTVSRSTRFISSNDLASGTVKNGGDMTGFYDSATGTWNTTWGIGLPFYNVDADVAFYGATPDTSTGAQRIGMGFALSTVGRDALGTRTTSILVIDGAPNANDGGNPTNYYMGIRNIDMYMAGQGSIGLEGNSAITSTKGLSINIDNFTLALAGEVAGGYLPGAKKKTGSSYVPVNNFALDEDVLFGLRLKLAGSSALLITPGDNSSAATNFPRLRGTMTLAGGALQIVEPVDKTVIGFDNIVGKIGLNNYIKIGEDYGDFSYTIDFNPSNLDSEVFRIKDVDMFPACSSGAGCTNGLLPAQRLGELVFTGGQLSSTLRLRPF